jgi:CheY-like chemotaxis protein
MKTRFLSDMSHEFRTPVNAILALSRLLDEWPLTTEARKQLSLIRHAAEDLESLVSDLLDLAKIEAGKIEIRAAEFEVVNLFSALRGMMRPLLVNRSVALVFEDSERLPTMYSDEGKIAQILRNFVSNALKFTERGEVRISAALGRGGDTIVFTVADTGIGISAEHLETIFEEFRQIENPLQSTYKGTGLGLPLARKLATLLGGNVTVHSEVGVGSTFRAELPLREAGMPSPAAARASRLAAPPMPANAAPLKILTIDDDETARYTLSSFAARPGMTIIEAENGVQGIARAQEERPDVILLDLMMPGIGGHEVLQRLKADPATAPIPVIIVTSRFINEDERQQILSRAANVIYKGDLSREIVTRAIEDAIGR